MTIKLTAADEAELKSILLAYRADGVANPRLPLNVDIDGDGVNDAWALNDNDEVILVPDVHLDDTVYVSKGDDIRAEVTP